MEVFELKRNNVNIVKFTLCSYDSVSDKNNYFKYHEGKSFKPSHDRNNNNATQVFSQHRWYQDTSRYPRRAAT